MSAEKRFEALMADLGWTDQSRPEAQVLSRLAYAAEDSRAQIRDHAASLQRDIDHVRKITSAASPLMNPLGELQQRPAAVEAAVGAFAVAERSLQDFLKIYRKAAVVLADPWCGSCGSNDIRTGDRDAAT